MNAESTPPPVTRRLAAFSTGDRAGRAPPTTGRLRVAGVLECAVIGSASEPVELALRVLRDLDRPHQAGVLGRNERLDAISAALINGIAAHAGGSGEGPEASVVVAALAAAELSDASVEQLSEAVMIGIEVTCRVARGFFPDAVDRGWHTGLLDAIGCAAAASRLLRLNENQAVSALSAAATQAAGLQVASGTMTRSFDVGKAAANGVEAAMLAARGFAGPEAGIEGKRGLSLVIAARPRFDGMVDGLGETWALESIAGLSQPADIPFWMTKAERVRDLIAMTAREGAGRVVSVSSQKGRLPPQ